MKANAAHRSDDVAILASVIRALAIHSDSAKLVETYKYQAHGYRVFRVSWGRYGVFWRGIRISENSSHTLSSAKRVVKRLRLAYARRAELVHELTAEKALAA